LRYEVVVGCVNYDGGCIAAVEYVCNNGVNYVVLAH